MRETDNWTNGISAQVCMPGFHCWRLVRGEDCNGALERNARKNLRHCASSRFTKNEIVELTSKVTLWVCPDCGRQFKHKNQAHSCVRLNPDDHFIGKDPKVRATYDKLLREVEKFGDVNVSSVKIGMMLKAPSTFVAVKPKKSWVDIEFILDEEINQFPVHKTFRYTKGRFAHFVRLEGPKDVSKKLLGWLKRSYLLVNGS